MWLHGFGGDGEYRVEGDGRECISALYSIRDVLNVLREREGYNVGDFDIRKGV